MVYHLYVLLLEGDNYYVGITRNPNRRFGEHFSGNGSKWSKLHSPISVISREEVLDEDIAKVHERILTLKYMKEYGINKVRGAGYPQVILPEATKRSIRKKLDHGCFICFDLNHWAHQCPYIY